MKISSRIAAIATGAVLLSGMGGAAAAFAAAPAAMATPPAASGPVMPVNYPASATSYSILGAAQGGTYHTKETGSQKIVSLWGSLDTTNTSSSFNIKLADGQVISMPAAKAFTVTGSQGVLKTSYAYGTDYKTKINFTDVRNTPSYVFANVDEPGLHLRNVELQANSELSGNYEFAGADGTYNGQDASISYGNIDFASKTGQLAIDDLDGSQVAMLKFTNVSQNGGKITLTTDAGQTITLTQEGNPGLFVYTVNGAGLNFHNAELVQD